jgi:hypothetical protein
MKRFPLVAPEYHVTRAIWIVSIPLAILGEFFNFCEVTIGWQACVIRCHKTVFSAFKMIQLTR